MDTDALRSAKGQRTSVSLAPRVFPSERIRVDVPAHPIGGNLFNNRLVLLSIIHPAERWMDNALSPPEATSSHSSLSQILIVVT